MSLIKREPWGDIERFFDDYDLMPLRKMSADLAVDLYEEEGKIIAKMNVPGADAEKLDVSVEEDMLRVSGSHEEEKEKKEKHYYSKEIKSGSFTRVVRLPRAVDREHVTAEYKNGVLEVTMPVAEGKKVNAVKVEVKK